MAFYIALSLLSLSFLILINYVLCIFIHRQEKPRVEGPLASYPRVSVLKPLKNSDDELEQNLESFFALDYPDFEIVFGVDTLDDDCAMIVDRLKKKYPAVRTKTVPVGTDKIMNPKIETMAKMEPSCEGELFWISDSNTRAEKGTLASMVRVYVEQGAKMVFSPVKGMGSRTAGSVMENAYLNLFVSGSIVCAWQYFSEAIVMGKSMLIEKNALDSLGSFMRFREYLAEDYIMGEVFTKNNIAISTSYTWVTNFNSHSTIKSFCSRVSRWSKLRFHINRPVYILEILGNPILLSLLFSPFWGAYAFEIISASIILKIAIEYATLFIVNREDTAKSWIVMSYPLLVMGKDILLFLVYLVPFFSSTVKWRGHGIRIGYKSKIFLEP